jgi:hypothetical protein
VISFCRSPSRSARARSSSLASARLRRDHASRQVDEERVHLLRVRRAREVELQLPQRRERGARVACLERPRRVPDPRLHRAQLGLRHRLLVRARSMARRQGLLAARARPRPSSLASSASPSRTAPSSGAATATAPGTRRAATARPASLLAWLPTVIVTSFGSTAVTTPRTEVPSSSGTSIACGVAARARRTATVGRRRTRRTGRRRRGRGVGTWGLYGRETCQGGWGCGAEAPPRGDRAPS